MLYYVYILRSTVDGTFYKGFTTDYLKIFTEHNDGLSRYTATKRPWQIIYVEEFANKRDALIREKTLKRGNKEYFLKLAKQDQNILNKLKE